MKRKNKNISKIGIILSAIYLALSIISIIYSRVCNKGICDVGYLVLPAIPWIAFLSGGRFDSTIIGVIVYVLSILINISIFYFIGFFIEKIIGYTIKKR